MTGDFNEPSSLLSFYNYDGKCSKCYIGGVDSIKRDKRQLFAIRVDELSDFADHINDYSIKKTIYLPNGEKAFYILQPNISI